MKKVGESFRIKNPRKGRRISVKCLVFIAVLLLAEFHAAALARSSSCEGIHVNILNIRNSKGTVACALFNSPTGFLREFLKHATTIVIIEMGFHPGGTKSL